MIQDVMIPKLNLKNGQKVYFASDFHLGSPNHEVSLTREKKICRWMDEIKKDCAALFLVGDMFDFWFEYKSVVPKGFIRFQGKLAEFVDSGIPIYMFAGNHDIWLFGYFTQELGIPIFRKPQVFEAAGKQLYLVHGDGLGPGDSTYKLLKGIFENKLCQWLFSRLHPNFSFSLANGWSAKSRSSHDVKESAKFRGEDEWLIIHSRAVEANTHHDYYIYGHRHHAINYPLSDESTYINLGEWFDQCTYGVFDGQEMKVMKFEG